MRHDLSGYTFCLNSDRRRRDVAEGWRPRRRSGSTLQQGAQGTFVARGLLGRAVTAPQAVLRRSSGLRGGGGCFVRLVQRSLERGEETGRLDWLGDVTVHAGREALLDLVRHGVCGERDDRRP